MKIFYTFPDILIVNKSSAIMQVKLLACISVKVIYLENISVINSIWYVARNFNVRQSQKYINIIWIIISTEALWT